jgi:8-oxo-dGTP pyrophosphatase MutT (NUDIX family)
MVVCQGKLLVERTWLGDGRWGLPGGGLHKGEASIDGALRELEEETGIKLAANDLQFIAGYRMSVQGLSFKYDLFKTELNMFPQLHQQTGEIVDIQWLTVAELLENVIRPDVEEALKIWPV